MLKFICASAVAVLATTSLVPAPTAIAQQAPFAEPAPTRSRARANDAYRPGPDQPGLGVLGGDGRAVTAQDYGSPPPASYPLPSYNGGPVYDGSRSGSGAPSSYGGPPIYGQNDRQSYGSSSPPYQPPYGAGQRAPSYGSDTYRPPSDGYASSQSQQPFGQPYAPPPSYGDGQAAARRPYMSGEAEPVRGGPPGEYRQGNSFSTDEIKNAGHGFFGSISQGLASVIEHTYRKKGRPNGYILGEEAGGAFVAGLRYGRGRLHTKDAGVHNVYWQGPSIGFDAGAEGSKVMILVYNLQDVGETFDRFGGIDGSAYVVGGVGVTFLSKDRIILAPIRSGIGLRLGANVGYLKFTPKPTWNPF